MLPICATLSHPIWYQGGESLHIVGKLLGHTLPNPFCSHTATIRCKVDEQQVFGRMPRLNKANVGWNGLLAKLAEVIREDWIPGNLTSEFKFRDSLEGFLRESAPKAHIETEYRHFGTTTDIYFKWEGFFSTDEVFIELKYNLRQKSEYDRLIGQITQINPKKHKTIIILCGDDHSESLIARLRETYKDLGGLVDTIRIIVKNADEDAARVLRRKREEKIRRQQQVESAKQLRTWLDEQAKKAAEAKKLSDEKKSVEM